MQKGHAVTVISSKPDKQAAIEAMGATATIDSVEDVPFLAATFTGADAVYCMPPNYSTQPDLVAYYGKIGGNYAQATVQVFSIEAKEELQHLGWLLLGHPDFLWNTPLTKKTKQSEYFRYSVNEALHLSEKEEATILDVVQNIKRKYQTNIDKFTQNIVIARLESLIPCTDRFYYRQFSPEK